MDKRIFMMAALVAVAAMAVARAQSSGWPPNGAGSPTLPSAYQAIGEHVNYSAGYAVLLNSSGWAVAYSYAVSPNSTVVAGPLEPTQRYLLVAYELNESTIYVGYAWLPGRAAESLMVNGSWMRAIRLIPLEDYPKGDVVIHVQLPSGPAGNGTVCVVPPLLPFYLIAPPPRPYPIVPPAEPAAMPINGTYSNGTYTWPSGTAAYARCSGVINGTAVVAGLPSIPYVATYYYWASLNGLLGLPSGPAATAIRNETVDALGARINVTVEAVTYYEANPSIVEASGRGLAVPGSSVTINATISAYPYYPYAYYRPFPARSTAINASPAPIFLATSTAQSTGTPRYLSQPGNAGGGSREPYLGYAYVVAITAAAVVIGAAAALGIGRRVGAR